MPVHDVISIYYENCYAREKQKYFFVYCIDIKVLYSPLIYIHIIIQVLLVLYFSKHIHLRQYYEFPFILRDLRHIYMHVLRQLQPKSKARAMIGRCKFIACVVGRKFL